MNVLDFGILYISTSLNNRWHLYNVTNNIAWYCASYAIFHKRYWLYQWTALLIMLPPLRWGHYAMMLPDGCRVHRA